MLMSIKLALNSTLFIVLLKWLKENRNVKLIITKPDFEVVLDLWIAKSNLIIVLWLYVSQNHLK